VRDDHVRTGGLLEFCCLHMKRLEKFFQEELEMFARVEMIFKVVMLQWAN